MNNKFKIAVIALLGFSTACCATRKGAKTGGESEEAEHPSILQDTISSRIKLMYGVPRPDGSTVQVLSDDEVKADSGAADRADNTEEK